MLPREALREEPVPQRSCSKKLENVVASGVRRAGGQLFFVLERKNAAGGSLSRGGVSIPKAAGSKEEKGNKQQKRKEKLIEAKVTFRSSEKRKNRHGSDTKGGKILIRQFGAKS